MIHIGIDPDIERNGVAVVDSVSRSVQLYSMAFAELTEWLQQFVGSMEKTVIVIEASWLVSHNWHFRMTDNRRKVASLGHAVGRNHQTGILLQECAERMGLDVRLRKPLRKCWKGKDGKITHKELVAVTGITCSRSNQEERDAALLAWVDAGLPIIIKTK